MSKDESGNPTAMDHPQPAFEFLLSLPTDGDLHQEIFIDWSHYVENADYGDDIRQHPEIWDSLELPECLAKLDETDTVGIQQFDGYINLNAMAIGLGLENITYDPMEFPALVYDLGSSDPTVLVWPGVMVAIGDSLEGCEKAIESTCERLADLGLTDQALFQDGFEVKDVGDIIN